MNRMMLRVAGMAACVLATAAPVLAQDTIFPMGELSHAQNHTGDIWLNELVKGDATFDPGIAVATYGPAAKLDWHVHPGGQVLLITEGSGYYQERGQPRGSSTRAMSSNRRRASSIGTARCQARPSPMSR